MLSLGNFLIPAVARVRAKQGLLAARRVALSQSTQAAFLLLPLTLLLLFIPRPLLGLFYGAASPYAVLEGPLRLLALTYVLSFWAMAIAFCNRSFIVSYPADAYPNKIAVSKVVVLNRVETCLRS
jgi:O-antigen/teichoic acid export membrane protein